MDAEGFREIGTLSLLPAAGVDDGFPETGTFGETTGHYRAATRLPPGFAGAMDLPGADAFLAAVDVGDGDETAPAPPETAAAGAGTSARELLYRAGPTRPAGAIPPPPGEVCSAGDESHAVAAFAHLFQTNGASDGELPSSTRRASDDVASGVTASMGDHAPDAHLESPATASDAVARARDAAPVRSTLPSSVQDMLRDGMAAVLTSLSSPVKTSHCEADADLPDVCEGHVRAEFTDLARGHDEIAGGAPPPITLRIAVCQLHATSGDVWANVAKVAAVAQAASGLCDLVVFPETFLSGYHIGPTLTRSLAVPLPSSDEVAAAVATGTGRAAPLPLFTEPGAWATWLPDTHNPVAATAAIAARFRVAIILPFAELGREHDPRNPVGSSSSMPPVYNSVVALDSDGRVARHYRKSHLWGAYEKQLFTPGPGELPTICTLPSWSICHPKPSRHARPPSPLSLYRHAQVPMCATHSAPSRCAISPRSPSGCWFASTTNFPRPRDC